MASLHLSLLWSTHLSSAVSDPWWTFYVTNRAPCNRERGTTPPCWPLPRLTGAHPKTSTPRSCKWKTTAVSDKAVRVKPNVFTPFWRWKRKAAVSYSGYTSLGVRPARRVPADREAHYHCCSPASKISLQTQLQSHNLHLRWKPFC